MKFAAHRLVATALAVTSFCAQAAPAPSMELLPPPDNWIFSGISNGGTEGVFEVTLGGRSPSVPTTGTWIRNAAGAYQKISESQNTNVNISADGSLINGSALNGSGVSQAAVYSVGSGSWTTLGGLNGGASTSYGISADGSTVVGNASYVGSKTTTHAVVFKNGTVTDLTPTATTASNAVAVSADGSVVVGSVNGSIINGTIWKLDPASGNYAATTITGTSSTGAAVSSVIVDHVSPNGAWAAGASTNAMGQVFGTIFTGTRAFDPATIVNTATGKATVIPYDHVIDTSPTSKDVDLNMKATITGISNDGTVIGMFNSNVGGATGITSVDSFIYFASTGQSMTFDSYLTSLGVGLTFTQHVWTLSSMSADGSAISGYYFDTVTNQSTGFILHDGILAAVPEPGTWMLFGLGLPLLMARRRLQRRSAA